MSATQRTCPCCGENVARRVARATFDCIDLGGFGFRRRKPKASTYPVVVQCSLGHYVEYAPLPSLELAELGGRAE